MLERVLIIIIIRVRKCISIGPSKSDCLSMLPVVCRYMGLGSEWSERWCVVMPRFPSVAAPANQQLTRSLLVIYKVCQPVLLPVVTSLLTLLNNRKQMHLEQSGDLLDHTFCVLHVTNVQSSGVKWCQSCICSTGVPLLPCLAYTTRPVLHLLRLTARFAGLLCAPCCLQ